MFLLIFVLHICFNQYSYLFIWNGGILCQRTTILFPITMYTCRSGVRCSDLIISANRCMIILNCPWLFPEAVHYNLMIICTVSGRWYFCINPLTLHELHGVNCVIITVLFNQTLFEQILPVPSHPRFFCISPMSDNQEAIAQLRSLIAHIIKTNVDKKMATNFATGHISIMLWILCTFISV